MTAQVRFYFGLDPPLSGPVRDQQLGDSEGDTPSEPRLRRASRARGRERDEAYDRGERAERVLNSWPTNRTRTKARRRTSRTAAPPLDTVRPASSPPPPPRTDAADREARAYLLPGLWNACPTSTPSQPHRSLRDTRRHTTRLCGVVSRVEGGRGAGPIASRAFVTSRRADKLTPGESPERSWPEGMGQGKMPRTQRRRAYRIQSFTQLRHWGHGSYRCLVITTGHRRLRAVRGCPGPVPW